MKYVYMLLVIVLFTAILVFALQNFPLVTVRFLEMRVVMPLSLVIIGVYLLGMFTGGFVSALMRRWIRATGRS